MDIRVRNAEVFEDTAMHCLMDEKLRRAVIETKRSTVFYGANEPLAAAEAGNDGRPMRLLVSAKRSFEAARAYAKEGKKVCVLNFASALQPGGGVLYGASAQEECLCRCSTLYYALETQENMACFYQPHKDAGDPVYNDDILYTEGVVVFKSDTDRPALLPEDQWFTVDVLTCAAPNRNESAYVIENREWKEIFRRRIRRILAVAAQKGAQVLILGAFGCGAFGNPAGLVAEAFYEELQSRGGCFEVVEFAVYCRPEDDSNYRIFSHILTPKPEDRIPSFAERIRIEREDISRAETACIVNPANEFLIPGEGVSRAIYDKAGREELNKVCQTHGHCEFGNCVITPGFGLQASYVIHAVPPVYQDGKQSEGQLLYSTYYNVLQKALDFGISSIAFPLLAAESGYPAEEAWGIALETCRDFLDNHPLADLQLLFVVREEDEPVTGSRLLAKMQEEREQKEAERLKAAEAAAGKETPERKAMADGRHVEEGTGRAEKPQADRALELMKSRRSVRSYRPDMVPRELIDSVIEAGRYAASGRNRQPVIILAVTNPLLRNRIAALNARIMGKENFDPFYGAPVILLVISEKVPTAVYDGSLALGNMMLRAHELGLGSCWIHRAAEEMEDEFGRSLLAMLGLEGDYVGIGHLALGYPAGKEAEAPARKEGRVFYFQ